ncbi:MAG: hypothetical protein ACKOSS_10775 [Planctomycetia bacterium]
MASSCRVLLLALACLGAGAARPAGAAPPGGEAARPAAGEDPAMALELARLQSPLRGERLEAEEALARRLPAAREALARAFEAGDEELKAALAEVLARDASPRLLHLLVEAWRSGGEALAARARDGLLRQAEAAAAALEGYRPAPGVSEARPVAELAALLERDRVERAFLERKSASGSTGYYHGQYAPLLPWRTTALDVCVHIVMDQALRMPGGSAAGGYRMVRPMGRVIDTWELRGMALNAVQDLARAEDHEVLARLDGYLRELASRPEGEDDGDIEREVLHDDLLATLYRLAPRRYEAELRQRVAELEGTRGWSRRGRAEAAQLALRAGWFDRAVRLYRSQLASSLSPAHDHYNLACAFAQWAVEPGKQDAEQLRRTALEHLARAVDLGWTDVAWTEQDGDLEPLRATEGYRALVARMKAVLEAPLPDDTPR